jgi:hypothetical protein
MMEPGTVFIPKTPLVLLKTVVGRMVETVKGKKKLFWSKVALSSTLKEVHEFATTLPLLARPVAAVITEPILGLLRQLVLLALSPVTCMFALNMMPSVLSGELEAMRPPVELRHELKKQLIAIEVFNDNEVGVLPFMFD